MSQWSMNTESKNPTESRDPRSHRIPIRTQNLISVRNLSVQRLHIASPSLHYSLQRHSNNQWKSKLVKGVSVHVLLTASPEISSELFLIEHAGPGTRDEAITIPESRRYEESSTFLDSSHRVYPSIAWRYCWYQCFFHPSRYHCPFILSTAGLILTIRFEIYYSTLPSFFLKNLSFPRGVGSFE